MKLHVWFLCLWPVSCLASHADADLAMFETRIKYIETAIQKAYCFSEDYKEDDFFLKPPMTSRSGWASRYIAYDLGIKSKNLFYASRLYIDNDGIVRSFSVPVLKKMNTSFNVKNSLGIIWYEIIKNINLLWNEHEHKQKFKIELDQMVFEVTHQPGFNRFVCNRVG